MKYLPYKINILCLCEDIGYPHTKIYKWFITWCSEHFTKVFIITGNHEYYSTKYTISQQWNKYVDFVKENKKKEEWLQEEVEFI